MREKTFAWYLDDHHGDGIVSVSCKMPLGENQEVVALDPTRYYLPAYMSHRGWVALRLDLGKVDWKEVEELVGESYRLIAPKRLAAATAAGRPDSNRRPSKERA